MAARGSSRGPSPEAVLPKNVSRPQTSFAAVEAPEGASPRALPRAVTSHGGVLRRGARQKQGRAAAAAAAALARRSERKGDGSGEPMVLLAPSLVPVTPQRRRPTTRGAREKSVRKLGPRFAVEGAVMVGGGRGDPLAGVSRGSPADTRLLLDAVRSPPPATPGLARKQQGAQGARRGRRRRSNGDAQAAAVASPASPDALRRHLRSSCAPLGPPQLAIPGQGHLGLAGAAGIGLNAGDGRAYGGEGGVISARVTPEGKTWLPQTMLHDLQRSGTGEGGASPNCPSPSAWPLALSPRRVIATITDSGRRPREALLPGASGRTPAPPRSGSQGQGLDGVAHSRAAGADANLVWMCIGNTTSGVAGDARPVTSNAVSVVSMQVTRRMVPQHTGIGGSGVYHTDAPLRAGVTPSVSGGGVAPHSNSRSRSPTARASPSTGFAGAGAAGAGGNKLELPALAGVAVGREGGRGDSARGLVSPDVVRGGKRMRPIASQQLVLPIAL